MAQAGVVRAHLPVSWAVELAAAGHAAGNPPPDELLDAVGARLHPELRSLIDRATEKVAVTAKQLLADLPAVPPYRLRIGVIGSLQLWRDGEEVACPDLRRQRVPGCCASGRPRRVRREEIADALLGRSSTTPHATSGSH